jgi:peptidyl-prolyl cis-trans isomerase SurA
MHAVRLASALALAAVLTVSARPSAEVIEQVVIKINGDIITKTELEQRQVLALRGRGIQPSDDAALKKAIEEVTPALLVDTIDEMLLVQRGRELGYKMTDDDFNRVVGNIRKENKLDSDEAFQAALKQEGMTLDDLRKQLERNLLVTRVQQVEVMGKISVNEEEVAKYYEANKSAFTSAPSVTLREILIAVPESDKGINVAADDAARAKAEDLRKRLLAGEPFAQLVSQSSDSGSKANGGLIGPISRDDLSPDLQKQLASMKVGELTPILRTTRGYQIIKLENATTAHTKTLDEARADVSEKLAETRRQSQLEQYLAHLREQAIIDWKNDEIKKAFEVGVKQRHTAES